MPLGRQGTSEEFVSQPGAIGVDDVGFAIFRDLFDPPGAIVDLNLRAIDAVRLARKAEHPTKLVKRDLRPLIKRRKRIAEIERVVGISIEVIACR